MYWANFLHFYQPAGQQEDIMEAIVAQSYRPILNGVKKNKKIRLTFNINGALLELFDKYRYRDLIDILRELGKEGRVEFTSSSKYHAFLPLWKRKKLSVKFRLTMKLINFTWLMDISRKDFSRRKWLIKKNLCLF